MFSYSSHVYIKTYKNVLGLSICSSGSCFFCSSKIHRSQGSAVIQSYPVPAHDRQNMNGTIDIHEFVMFFRTRRGCEKWCCEFVRLPLSLGRWLLVAGCSSRCLWISLGAQWGQLRLKHHFVHMSYHLFSFMGMSTQQSRSF